MGPARVRHRLAFRHPQRARATRLNSDGLIAQWMRSYEPGLLLEELESSGVPARRIFTAKDMLADARYAASR